MNDSISFVYTVESFQVLLFNSYYSLSVYISEMRYNVHGAVDKGVG